MTRDGLTGPYAAAVLEGRPAAAEIGMRDGMRIGVLGAGCSKSRDNLSTAFVVESDGHWLGIDCPHPIRYALGGFARRNGVNVDVDDIDSWLITHVHADHCSGLESVAFLERFHYHRRTRIAAHGDVLGTLWDRHLAAGMADTLSPAWTGCLPEHHEFDEYFDQVQLTDTTAVTIGPFTVELHRTRHVVPTFAVRVTAGRVSFAYSSDTVADAALAVWLDRADVVAHDTAADIIHASVDELAGLISPARRRRWLAVHHGDDLDRDRCRALGFVVPDDATLLSLAPAK